jgi:hypothetical protein
MDAQYSYEIRRGAVVVATGQFAHGSPLEAGDRITIGRHQGLIRAIYPPLADQPPRLIVELLPPG